MVNYNQAMAIHRQRAREQLADAMVAACGVLKSGGKLDPIDGFCYVGVGGFSPLSQEDMDMFTRENLEAYARGLEQSLLHYIEKHRGK